MSKVDSYREELAHLPPDAWPAWLAERSNLPGPRANLELVSAAAEEADEATAFALAGVGDEFTHMCGVVALGRHGLVDPVREAANDERWRVREAAAMALQRLGDEGPERLAAVAAEWAGGTAWEARCAAAAVAEPRLLRTATAVDAAVAILERATDMLAATHDPVLAKGLAYAWSVVAAADLERVRPAMEQRLDSEDPVVRRALRENLRKARLQRLDPVWAGRWLA
jgi:HEAT repeat